MLPFLSKIAAPGCPMTSTKRRGGGAINNQTPVKGGVSEVVTSAVRAVDICWPLVGTTT